jgi:hypothetical protein
MPSGGMDANPFGGNARLDRIDFLDYASGTDSPWKLLYLKVISDAVSDYLYFGLGKNGTVADDFFYATEYFFKCRSFLPETWKHANSMRHAYVDEVSGKRVSSHLTLTDEELRQACFDRHYEIAELHNLMPFDQFIEWLKVRRSEILEENKAQVNAYIDLLQRTALREVIGGQQIPFKLDSADRMQVLTRPTSPEQVAELVFYAPRYRRQNRPHRQVTRREIRIASPHVYRHVAVPSGQTQFALEAA